MYVEKIAIRIAEATLSFVITPRYATSRCIGFFASTWSAFSIFRQSTYSIPGETIPRYWIDWDSWVRIELRPIPTLGHSPFSLSLSLSRIHTHIHIHSLFTLPSSFFSFSFPFSVVRRVVFVSVYRVRVPLQFFGFIYFASSSLFPYSSFVRASFDSTLYIDRRCRALIFACRAPKKKGTYAIVCVSILHRNPSSRFEKVGHRFSTIRFHLRLFQKSKSLFLFLSCATLLFYLRNQFNDVDSNRFLFLVLLGNFKFILYDFFLGK